MKYLIKLYQFIFNLILKYLYYFACHSSHEPWENNGRNEKMKKISKKILKVSLNFV